MMHRTIGKGLLTLTLAAMTGCQKEGAESFSSSDIFIRPAVTGVSDTKAEAGDYDGTQIAAIPISEDPDDSLYLIVYEKDMPDRFMDVAATRGTEVTEDNLDLFYIKAYAEDDWHDNETNQNFTAGEYFAATEVTLDSGSWEMADEYDWLNNVPLSLWSWNAVEPEVDPADGYDKASFSYSLLNSVTSQEDLIFAYNGENRKFDRTGAITEKTSTNTAYNRTDNEVDVHFYHALSAIKFDISGVQDGQSVDQITIGGVASSGDCEITVSGGVPEFEWDNLGTAKSYSQTFTSTDFDTDGKQVSGGSKEFFMIPQALTDDATLTVTFDGTASTPKAIKAGGVEWKAGKYYTYKITKTAYEWDYTFSIEENGYTFKDNKSLAESHDFNIRSIRTRQDDNSVVEAVDWLIKSYKIGNSSPVTVNGTSISRTDCWAYTAADPTVGNKDDVLYMKAVKADKIECGSNDFWCNSNGRTYDLDWSPAHWTGGSAIDLSKMDYTQDDRSLAVDAHSMMTTSNCYIIRHAGTYKLPLVYGNARKNGENTASYCSEGIDSNPNRLSRFVNHLDRGITSSFIENNDGCIANSCEIVWQSDGPVLSELEILGNKPSSTGGFTESNVRYLQFKVDPLTVQQTNALIAIKDDQNRIIWSWHIWVTNNPDVVGDPIKVTNYSNIDYYFLGVNNIGDITTYRYRDRDDVVITLEQKGSGKTLDVTLKQYEFMPEGNGLIYEYGRKDPFPCKDTDYSGKTILTFYNDGYTATTREEIEAESARRSIGRWIQSPDVYVGGGLFNNYNYYWLGRPYSNLWTGLEAGNCIEEFSDNTVKTIYDPSPVGYQIPMIGAFSGFDLGEGKVHVSSTTKSNWNVVSTEWDNGYVMWTSLGPGNTVNTQGSTIRFRGDGMRAYRTGKWLDSRGTYFSASCNITSPVHLYIYYLVFTDTAFSAYQSTVALENGATVRPVRENQP